MHDRTRLGLAVFMGAALMVSVATHGHAGDLRFEHVMNIGAEGRGAGQAHLGYPVKTWTRESRSHPARFRLALMPRLW